MPGYPAQSRTDAFGEGTSSFADTQNKLNSAIPRGYRQQGVNQPTGTYSGIGSSAADQARLVYGSTPVGGTLPTANGSAPDTYRDRRNLQSTNVSL